MVPDDYELCLKHEVGDFDAIPEKVLKDLRDFAANTFMPAVFEYLGDTYPKYRRYSVYYVQREGFFPPSGAFTKEQEYDLNEATDLLHIPHFVSDIIDGKRAVGSAIRICKAINKPEQRENMKKKSTRIQRILIELRMVCLWNHLQAVSNVLAARKNDQP